MTFQSESPDRQAGVYSVVRFERSGNHDSRTLRVLDEVCEFSLRKPKVFALQILQRCLTKEGRVRNFFHCLYG